MPVVLRRELEAGNLIAQPGEDSSKTLPRPSGPGLIVLALLAVAALLAAVSFGTQLYLLRRGLAAPFAEAFSRFDIDGEATVPAWYATVLLLACAGLLAVIARHVRGHGQPFKLRWALLALVFVGLSADEACAFHEIALNRFEARLDSGGIFYFLWVWAALPVVLVMGLFFLPLVWSLPKRIAVLFTVAGLIFLGGALGAEAVSGWIVDHYGVDETAYIVTATVEECMEYVGVILFLYALLLFRQTQTGQSRLPTA